MLIGVATALAVAASAQVAAPPPPDEPAIYISSTFVEDDGAAKVVQDVTIDVAGVSITAPTGRMRRTGQLTLQNATVTVSPTVATHVQSRMVYRGEQIRDLPAGK